MHLGGHELACCDDDVFALLAGEVAVDVSGVLEEIGGVALQELHVLQRPLKLLRLLDDLEHAAFQLAKQNKALRPLRQGRTVLYFSSWLLLFGMECTRHSWMIHRDISSQISSPKMVESFLSPMDTSEKNNKKNQIGVLLSLKCLIAESLIPPRLYST